MYVRYVTRRVLRGNNCGTLALLWLALMANPEMQA